MGHYKILRRKFIVINVHIKKKETNILTLYCREWEKEQTKSKGSRRRDVPMIRVQVNEIETRKTVGKDQ